MRSVHDYADPVACVLFSFRPLRLELAHRNPKLRHSRHDAVVADSTSQHRWEAHDLPPQKPGRNKQVNAVNGGYIVFDVLSILVKIGNMTEHVWSYMIYVFTFLFVSVLQCVFVVQCFFQYVEQTQIKQKARLDIDSHINTSTPPANCIARKNTAQLKLNGTVQVPRQMRYVTTYLEAEVGGWKLRGFADDFLIRCPMFSRKIWDNTW